MSKVGAFAKVYIIVIYTFSVALIGAYVYLAGHASLELEKTFTNIYENDGWGGGSGPGSDQKNAKPYLKILQDYVDAKDIKTIYDLGCGDWRLTSTITIDDSKSYYGYDVVKSVVDENREKYHKPNVSFYHIAKLHEFEDKKGDLLIVKDVIQHWPNKEVEFFIDRILPNFKYALIVNDYSSSNSNSNINYGGCRAINLEHAPFNMGDQLSILTDYQSHGLSKRVYLYTNRRELQKN